MSAEKTSYTIEVAVPFTIDAGQGDGKDTVIVSYAEEQISCWSPLFGIELLDEAFSGVKGELARHCARFWAARQEGQNT